MTSRRTASQFKYHRSNLTILSFCDFLKFSPFQMQSYQKRRYTVFDHTAKYRKKEKRIRISILRNRAAKPHHQLIPNEVSASFIVSVGLSFFLHCYADRGHVSCSSVFFLDCFCPDFYCLDFAFSLQKSCSGYFNDVNGL